MAAALRRLDVFIHVQHLLGSGHLRRAAALARALAARGHRVLLASGGRPLADLDHRGFALLQLPPIHARDGDFGDLVDARGRPFDAALRARRRRLLLDHFAARRADVLITETFPFGRRALRGELLALLDAAAQRSPRPLRLSSIRDILQPAPHREAEVLDLLHAHYDALLVHGDPALAPLSLSFPAARLRLPLDYAGYLDSAPPAAESLISAAPIQRAGGEILVSAGGGAVGLALLRAALDARAAHPADAALAGRRWRLRAGPNLPAADFHALQGAAQQQAAQQQAAQQQAAQGGVIVERNRDDFAARLAHCAASVSQAGYNTVVDLLRSAAPAVLVPYARRGEREQSLRAARLAELGRAQRLAEDGLSGAALAAALQSVLAAPPQMPAVHIDRGQRAAELIEQRCAEREP